MLVSLYAVLVLPLLSLVFRIRWLILLLNCAIVTAPFSFPTITGRMMLLRRFSLLRSDSLPRIRLSQESIRCCLPARLPQSWPETMKARELDWLSSTTCTDPTVALRQRALFTSVKPLHLADYWRPLPAKTGPIQLATSRFRT